MIPFVLHLLLATLVPSDAEKYFSIGSETTATFNLQGPVRQVTTCNTNGTQCSTIKFNSSGISLSSLEGRVLLSKKNQLLVFSRFDPHLQATLTESFQNRQLVVQELKSELLHMKTQYVYDSRGLLIKVTAACLSCPDQSPRVTRTISYQNGLKNKEVNYSRRYFQSAEETAQTTYFNAHGAPETFSYLDAKLTYIYDSHGNWVKSFQDGQPYQVRKIEYYK